MEYLLHFTRNIPCSCRSVISGLLRGGWISLLVCYEAGEGVGPLLAAFTDHSQESNLVSRITCLKFFILFALK
jgi:hypothetical protein